jgi:2-polyprenyl-3-methyl-5-hydroxy-6-metoxy-1,4-benzoquinol methylase
MQIISWFKKAPSSLSFFDFGMGWGEWALMAKAFGCRSYGSELSKICLEYANSNGINIVSWDEIPQSQFDFINTEQVFEHISNPLQTLCHLKKGLKADGLLKISVPTVNFMERRLRIMDWNSHKGTRNSLNPVAPLEHINFYRRTSLIMMANLSGMKEVFLPIKNQYQYTTEWVGVKRIAKNMLLPIFRNILKRRNIIFLKRSE